MPTGRLGVTIWALECAHERSHGVQEMLIFGRGGEGVVLASQLLADAFARAGWWAQSFPEFKAERRGAPISAFLRWDPSSPIRRRYRVRDCDVLVGISPSAPPPELLSAVRPGGLVLLNREDRLPLSGGFEIARVPATRISRETMVLSSEGRPMGNVAVLGACISMLLPDGLGFLEEAILARLGSAAQLNISAARAGLCALHPAAATPGRPAPPGLLGQRSGRWLPHRTALPGEHDGLARQPHRLLVARPSRPDGGMQRVWPLRALLPRGCDDEGGRRNDDRLPLLQGLRDLRGRLPRAERDRDGGGAVRARARADMSVAIPSGRMVLTSDEAAASAVMLARARVIGCYPITPQTVIVERLADLVVGHRELEFANLESEHAMFAYVTAAARVGVRTFTATSSQGLLYAHEQLHRASRERVPLVAVNVNRAVFAPWSIQPDLSDSMSQRDTGWIQLYCASAQEVLDSIICAYRIAESVMLPVLVCAEGFLLSHTSEVVEVPEHATVDAFLPEFKAPDDWLLDPRRARAFSELPEPAGYYAFQRHVADAMHEARDVIETVTAEFTTHFGRHKAGALELAGNLEADTALITIGSIGESALELLDDDENLLLVRVHGYRPFPGEALAAALAGVSYVSVIDRAPAFGSLGPLGADVLSLDLRHVKAATSFVGGLGGIDVTPLALRWALSLTRSSSVPGRRCEPVYIPEGVQ